MYKPVNLVKPVIPANPEMSVDDDFCLPFDDVYDEGKPSRHHYFYFEDGSVVLKVSRLLGHCT
jgi:hypothetical protein